MAINSNDWNAIWNEGYQTGWNDRYKQGHPVTHAPSAAALNISRADWDKVYNAGFDAAYGKRVSAPGPGVIPNLPAKPAPTPAPAPALAPAPIATIATVQGGGGAPSGPQFGLDAEQWGNLYWVLRIGVDLGAPWLALQAMLLIGFGENNAHTYGCNNIHACGFFQLLPSWQSKHPYTDVGYWAHYAYQQGFYGKGGLIALARQYPTESAGYITNLCQGAYSNYAQGAAYYNQYRPQANQVYNYWIPRLKGLPGGVGRSPGPSGPAAPAPTPKNALPLFKSLTWGGDMKLLWAGAAQGAGNAVTDARKFFDHYQAYDYVKPSAFS